MQNECKSTKLEFLLEIARRANWDALHGPMHLKTGRFHTISNKPGLIKFKQAMPQICERNVDGNYVEDRQQWQKDYSVDKILAELEK